LARRKRTSGRQTIPARVRKCTMALPTSEWPRVEALLQCMDLAKLGA
jgi:hypothetical protein